MGRTHVLDRESVVFRWNNAIPAALEIEPGDTVVFDTPEITRGQITPDSTIDAIATLDFSLIHQISGPIAIKGAEPGDTLVVEVLEIVPKSWAWTAIIPGFGLLASDPDFQEPYLKIWDLSNGRSTELKPGVTVPFEPFCGVMGVAPAENGEFSTIAPGSHDGNIDIRQLVAGSTAYFPIHVPGANFALGDVHAAQGDGEACGAGIECEATVTARFNLMKRHAPKELFFRTPSPLPGSWNTAGWLGTTAHGPDLFQSSQEAIRTMIGYLGRAHGLSPQEAYVLCSACVDLKISEIVDAPNWIVSALLPMGVFSAR
jgi:acetamidase/formamidase